MSPSRPDPRSSRSAYPELNASFGGVRPFKLHGVSIQLLCLPGTDVANLPVCIVVPALTWNRIGDGFAQLVGRRQGQGVERREPAKASCAVCVGHHCVQDVIAGGVVIAAKIGTRSRS